MSRSLMFAALMLSACGGAPTVVVGPPIQPPQPVACADEWVHMPVLINFPSGGTEIDAQNRSILAEVVRTAQTRDDLRRVRVEGHTDSCGAEGNNMVLSEARAHSVAAELTALGVPVANIETVGFGSTRPRAPNGCQHLQGGIGEAENRRVEFTLLVCRR